MPSTIIAHHQSKHETGTSHNIRGVDGGDHSDLREFGTVGERAFLVRRGGTVESLKAHWDAVASPRRSYAANRPTTSSSPSCSCSSISSSLRSFAGPFYGELSAADQADRCRLARWFVLRALTLDRCAGQLEYAADFLSFAMDRIFGADEGLISIHVPLCSSAILSPSGQERAPMTPVKGSKRRRVKRIARSLVRGIGGTEVY